MPHFPASAGPFSSNAAAISAIRSTTAGIAGSAEIESGEPERPFHDVFVGGPMKLQKPHTFVQQRVLVVAIIPLRNFFG